jgi:hypothetical protein
MKNYGFKLLLLFGIASSIIGLAAVSAQSWQKRDKPDLGAFIKEIVSIKVSGNQTQSAIWLPLEFYIEVNQRIQEKNSAQIEKELAPLKPYLIFMVQCSMENPDLPAVYESLNQLYTRATLKDKKGSEIKPLLDIPQELSARLNAIKSLMSQDSAGSAANMHILVFPSKNADGNPIVNTNKRDKLTLVLNKKGLFNKAVFIWRTPFDALTENITCLNCGESLSAKWHYCPWCGQKL